MPSTNHLNQTRSLIYKKEVEQMPSIYYEVVGLIFDTFKTLSSSDINELTTQILCLTCQRTFSNNAFTLNDLNNLLQDPLRSMSALTTEEQNEFITINVTRKASYIHSLYKHKKILEPKNDKLYCDKNYAIDLLKYINGPERIDAFAAFLSIKNKFSNLITDEFFSAQKFMKIIDKTEEYTDEIGELVKIKNKLIDAEKFLSAKLISSGKAILDQLIYYYISEEFDTCTDYSNEDGYDFEHEHEDSQSLTQEMNENLVEELTGNINPYTKWY